MVLFKNTLVIVFGVLLSAGAGHAAGIMLKIACVEQEALNTFNAAREGESSVINYNGMVAALSAPLTGILEQGREVALGSRLVPVEVRYFPEALQALYPDRGRIIGSQQPGAAGCWHKRIIDAGSGGRTVFFEVVSGGAVLDSLATGSPGPGLLTRPVEQYTQGGTPGPEAVFTTGYSVFLRQVSGPGGREWLEEVMPLKNGIGVLGLRRSPGETRTDTLIVRVDASRLPQSAAGMPQALIITGWMR